MSDNSQKAPVHKVARNSLINGMAFGIVAFLGFINVSLVVRFFGVETQGLVALGNLLSVKGYFAIVVLGLPTLISRKVAHYLALEDKNILKDWLYSSYLFTLILGLIFSVCIGIAFILPEGRDFFYSITGLSLVPTYFRNMFVLLLMITLPLQFFSVVAQAVLFGAQDFLSLRKAEIIFSVLTLLAIIAMILFKVPGDWILIMLPGFEVLKGIYLLVQSQKLFKFQWILQGHYQSIRAVFLKEMKVFTAASFMAFFDNTAPSIFVSQILGISGLGIYDTLTKASKILKTAFGFLNAAILPHSITVEAQKGHESVSKMFLQSSFLVGFITLPIVFIAGAMSPDILKIWLGVDFATYSKEFSVSLLFVFIMILLGMQGAVFSARLSVTRGMTKVNFLENLIGLPALYFQATSLGVLGVFLNRFLVVFVGLFPRTWIVAREYKFKVRSFLYNFRFSIPIGVASYGVLVTVSVGNAFVNLLMAVLCLLFSWMFLFFLSNPQEKEILNRLGVEVGRIGERFFK